MTAKCLIIKPHWVQIVNNFLKNIYETPYKLLNTLKYSQMLLNSNILFSILEGRLCKK